MVLRREELRSARCRTEPWREGITAELTVSVPPRGAYTGCVLGSAPRALEAKEAFVLPSVGLRFC